MQRAARRMAHVRRYSSGVMEERVRGLRGAITLEEDTKEQVVERTGLLLRTLLERNGIRALDLVSIFFTATEDLRSEFPAAAARELGLLDVPLLCARELSVDGGVPMCIRILIHFYTKREVSELKPVYLEGAKPLRADLADG